MTQYSEIPRQAMQVLAQGSGFVSDGQSLGQCLSAAQEGLRDGNDDRGGPVAAGGPEAVAEAGRQLLSPMIPESGVGAERAVYDLSRFLSANAANPNDPTCMAHLHCPTLSVAVAADMAASATNQSLDSWDQAPGAVLLEARFCSELAKAVYPNDIHPDAIATTGATESNFIAILLARERARAAGEELRVVCGENAHHSIARAAWMAGLRTPVTIKCRAGRIDTDHAEYLLRGSPSGLRTLIVATAGTTDAGCIDPLEDLADLAELHRCDLHIDAAYAGPLILCDAYADKLRAIDRSITVAMDFHKLGWQPIACGMLAVRHRDDLAPLAVKAEYLNSEDDVHYGFPDVLGRSIRTSRRPDLFKLATTLRATGRQGFERLVSECFAAVDLLADGVAMNSELRLWDGQRDLTTVLFRPRVADAEWIDGDVVVAEVRRRLLRSGKAVVGRARVEDGDGLPRLWFKMTILNPALSRIDVVATLSTITQESARVAEELGR